MILRYTIFFRQILLIIVIVSSVEYTSSVCDQFCGGNKDPIPYPFGFSLGCQIPLDCIDGKIRIGDFIVNNFTGDHILVNLPARCNRSIQVISQLNRQNYALTRRNSLLLQNCSTPTDCLIPTRFVADQFQLRRCEPPAANDSLNCYSEDYKGVEFMDFANLTKANCGFLYSSIAFDSAAGNTSTAPEVSLEFQTLELGWWVSGDCKCDRNAGCTNVTLPGKQLGFRCRCRQGYDGDGFADGKGCRRVPTCNPSNYMSGECGGTTRVGVLVGGVIAGASLMSTVALICYCIRKRSAMLESKMRARHLTEAAGSSSVPFYSYKEIERATDGFSDKQRLGTGAYGTVYAGKLNNGEWFAIKKIRHRDTEGIEQVMNEIKLLSSVSHPNLVRLLGCCIERGEQILVYEFMANGTLSQHLQGERGRGLPWNVRLTIATQTAHAIAYLHAAITPPIYHRDIKSSNILLDYNYNSKVADFGLSRLGMTDDSHISTAPQGTPGYVDPQYHQNYHLSDKSDVYSFGVVLVEIITAMKVVDFSRPHSDINLAALAIDRIGKGRVDEIMDPFLEPNRDAWTLSSIHKAAELAFRCLAFHRDMRPSMTEVADELEQIRISRWVPGGEMVGMGSSVASSCSSPFNGSEKSAGGTVLKKVVSVQSRRLVLPPRMEEEVKDCSPLSVHDPWSSEDSSPSTNSLLSNIVR